MQPTHEVEIGGFVGSLIMGLYLLFSIQIFGRHSEQEDRCAGRPYDLAIGIDRVSRKWKKANGATSSMWVPGESAAPAA